MEREWGEMKRWIEKRRRRERKRWKEGWIVRKREGRMVDGGCAYLRERVREIERDG